MIAPIHITFIVPYSELQSTVEDVFRTHPRKEAIAYAITTKTFEELDLGRLTTDILIGRGWTAHLMQQTELPFIDMTVTGFDITTAVSECVHRFRPRKVAIIGPSNTVFGVEEIDQAFPCRLKACEVSDPGALTGSIEAAVGEGCDVVVCGQMAHDICRKLGVPSVLITSGRKTVRQAVDEAIRTVTIRRSERERSDRFQSIMDYSFEGIIATDAGGSVTVINRRACEILHRTADQALSTAAADLLPHLDIGAVLSHGSRILGEIMTLHGRRYTANCVPAGKAGAVITFSDITRIQALEQKIRTTLHKKGLVARYTFPDIIGDEPIVKQTVSVALRFAGTDSNICILGETGTGKELFAQSIHNASDRRDHPFVAVNCAALAEDLLESELFGYVDGAFTGASRGGKAGLFELAHNGTIFLDEVGDISSKLQSKLLRVLQEREIMRLGHDRVIPVDIRVISASNRDLTELVAAGRFREDLYYRLNVLRLRLPALRKRKNDIILLAHHFLQQKGTQSRGRIEGFTPEAQALLRAYSWPGNIRELRNVCERVSVLAQTELATEQDVRSCLDWPPMARSNEATVDDAAEKALYRAMDDPAGLTGLTLSRSANLQEKELILNALGNTRSRKEAARKLGIDPSTLWRKMKRHHLL